MPDTPDYKKRNKQTKIQTGEFVGKFVGELATTGVETKTTKTLTVYEKKDDGVVGVQRKFKYYGTENDAKANKICIGYAFDAKLIKQVQ